MSYQKLTFDETCTELSKLGFLLGFEDNFENIFNLSSRFQIWVHPTNHILFNVCEFGPNKINEVKMMGVWKLKPNTDCETFLENKPSVGLSVPDFWRFTNPSDRFQGYLDNTIVQYSSNSLPGESEAMLEYYKHIQSNAEFLTWDKQPLLLLCPGSFYRTVEYINANYTVKNELRNSKNKENLMSCIIKLSLDPKNFGL
jgi:hypothetical protein